jgi:histidine triad (HIT) family protein
MAYDPNNIFARILRGEAPAHRVYEDADTIAFLDVMPQSDGHTLVLPRAAAENIHALDDAAAMAVMRTGRRVAGALKLAFSPDGITLTQFNGAAAGQTVFHFHLHVIPRWEGKPLRRHGGGFADASLLTEHAERVRAALAQLP